jgi:hypothetical protein
VDSPKHTKDLTVAELCKELGITQQRVSMLLRRGRFPNAYKHGPVWAIPFGDVVRYKLEKAEKERKSKS